MRARLVISHRGPMGLQKGPRTQNIVGGSIIVSEHMLIICKGSVKARELEMCACFIF